MKKIVLVFLFAFAFSSCEKDDICDANTPTTPRLIIDFYDNANPTALKNVINLKVIGSGLPDDKILEVFNGKSTIKLPLKTTENSTKYRLILNSTSTTSINEDILQFNYTHEDIFVSRACGFKTIFKLNSPTGVVQTEPSAADGSWIKSYTIETTNIDNENETHIKIYF